jgi:transcriptional regulator with XRE-family HTH domain
MKPRSDYKEFESFSTENRRLLREEELILGVTVALSEAMDKAGVSKSQLAEKLGKSAAFVTQILSGGRNLTLRTVADVADALGTRVTVRISRPEECAIVVQYAPKKYTPWNWGQVAAPKIQTNQVKDARPEGMAAWPKE